MPRYRLRMGGVNPLCGAAAGEFARGAPPSRWIAPERHRAAAAGAGVGSGPSGSAARAPANRGRRMARAGGGKGLGKADHWNKKAKAEGFPARSVYKLEEIDRRFKVLPRGGRVLDLGCCPGSWSQLVARRAPGVRLVGVDIQPVEGYPGTFLLGSALELPATELRAALGGPADLVLSDMAPLTTGNRLTDHVAQLRLADMAFHVARELLAPGGTFVAKVFDGEDAHPWTLQVRPWFEVCRRVRPEATRDASVEFFFVCQGFRPPPGAAAP